MLETNGTRPPAAHDHSLIAVSDFELILLGGAIGDAAGISVPPPFLTKSESGSHNTPCSLNNDVYLFDTRSFSWNRCRS